MAKIFKYEGVTTKGKKVSGEIEALDERRAKQLLRRQSIKVSKLTAPNPLDIDLGVMMVNLGLAAPFSQDELGRFTRQLSTLINAGVPIVECLESLMVQEKSPVLKSTIKNILKRISDGKSFNEALAPEKGFDKLYVALVKAGESAGILDTILNKLGEFMEKQGKIKKKVKGAMVYPSMVVLVGIGVVIGLMVFVVPQFVQILKDGNQEIPWITQMVMDISNFMIEYFLLIILFLIGGGIGFFAYIRSKDGKKKWDRVSMKAPIFGGIIIKSNLANFSRTLGTMLGAGVSILESLDICVDVIDNTQIAKDIKMVRQSVTKGKSITEPLSRIKYFPAIVNQMVKVGESTGNLDQMLIKVSKIFDDETETLIDGMTKMIEPMILVFLGGMIAVVLVAMYLPIFMSAGAA